MFESYLHVVVSGVMNALIMHFETRFCPFVLCRVPASAHWHQPDYLQAINSTAACTRLRADGFGPNKHYLIVKVEQQTRSRVSDGFPATSAKHYICLIVLQNTSKILKKMPINCEAFVLRLLIYAFSMKIDSAVNEISRSCGSNPLEL